MAKFRPRLTRSNMNQFGSGPSWPNFSRGRLDWIRPIFNQSRLDWILLNFSHDQLCWNGKNFVQGRLDWIWPNLDQGRLSQISVEAYSTELDRISLGANSTKFSQILIVSDTAEYTKFRCPRPSQPNTIKFGQGSTRPNLDQGQLNWIQPNFQQSDFAKYDQISSRADSAQCGQIWVEVSFARYVP